MGFFISWANLKPYRNQRFCELRMLNLKSKVIHNVINFFLKIKHINKQMDIEIILQMSE